MPMPVIWSPPRHHRVQQRQCLGLGAVAMGADQQTSADAGFSASLPDRAQHALHDGGKGNAAFGEALRPDEHLGARHAIRVGPSEIGQGDVVEIPLGDQDAATLEIQVQKGLQVVEAVGGAQRVRRRPPQGQAVAPG